MTTRWTTFATVLVAVLAVLGCGGDGGIGGTGFNQQGTLEVSVTDAPACGYDAVNLTISKVRVHKGSSATDADAGWSEIALNPAKRINLLSLTNGLMEDLGQTTLPAGRYTQLRLVLAANTGSNPLANSVVPSGGAEVALATPSAQQSGLKLNADIEVPAGQTVRFALDFDACKSIVPRGNSGQFGLKPVIGIIPVLADAGLRIEGHVDPTMVLASTNVSLQVAGAVVKATPPDSLGKFVLYPVPAGTYDLVVTSPGRVTAVMTAVPAVSGAPTLVNTASIPITPPSASMRTVTGTVTPASATVRAVQGLTGGPLVETAWAAVHESSGAFSMSLPIGAPIKVGYVSNPSSLMFVADVPASSLFAVQATSNGAVQSRSIDTSSVVAPIVFSFP